MAYWKSKSHSAPTKFANQLADSTASNDIGGTEEGKGDNSSLIEALKKQDVAKQEVEALKKGSGNTNGNINI